MENKINTIVTKSKPIISWKIDAQTAALFQAKLKWDNPVFVCFTPETTDSSTRITCEERKIFMGGMHFTSDPLSGEFKFDVVGERNLVDARGSVVWFIPVQGLAEKIFLRIHHNLNGLCIAGSEIVVDESFNVSWVVRDSMSLVVRDFEMTE
jgi:hypothetical protein